MLQSSEAKARVIVRMVSRRSMEGMLCFRACVAYALRRREKKKCAERRSKEAKIRRRGTGECKTRRRKEKSEMEKLRMLNLSGCVRRDLQGTGDTKAWEE